MELKNLYAFVLLIVTVGMILGVGVLTLDKFSVATFYVITDKMDSITPANNSFTALSYGNITNSGSVVNATGGLTFPATCYTVYPNGTFLLDIQDNSTCSWGGYDLNVTYNAKDYNTVTSTATTGALNEVSGIATNWLGLITTVSILALILFLVVSSFGGGLRR